MKTLEQAIKYGLVGVSNTLITMVVIWLMLKTLGLPEGLSNFTGYVAGLLNSYIWNRQWTFKGSTTGVGKSIVRLPSPLVSAISCNMGLSCCSTNTCRSITITTI